jgi:hypothetical protein
MSQTPVIMEFMRLTLIGLNEIAANIDVVKEEDCIIVRDCIIDFEKGIHFFNANSPEKPFMSFPSEAVVSAATFICVHMATGIITRVIEDAEVT